ncbi:MAG: 50S ribosomal protein L29 [Aaplasma endosymbiont of Hyalomma asiaticum]
MSSIAKMENKSSKELREMLVVLRRDLVKNIFDSKTGGTVDSARRSIIRKDIARVLTLLSLRKIRGEDV